jgi:hypothetical protein
LSREVYRFSTIDNRHHENSDNAQNLSCNSQAASPSILGIPPTRAQLDPQIVCAIKAGQDHMKTKQSVVSFSRSPDLPARCPRRASGVHETPRKDRGTRQYGDEELPPGSFRGEGELPPGTFRASVGN